MAKQCSKCGNYLLDDEKFCTRCGTNVNSNSTPSEQQTVPNTQQAAPNAQQSAPAAVAPQYQQPQAADDGSAQMGVGSWVGTIILTTWFGLISIILLFVWGFGSNVPKAKANYCKAMLIFQLIGIVIGILFTIFFFAAIVANADQLEVIINDITVYLKSL